MKMPLIILRNFYLLVVILLFASCGASNREINVSGSPFGRAPTAKLLVPSHLVVKKVNNLDVQMPLLSSGNVTLLLAEGENELEIFFEYIYEATNTDSYERVTSESFFVKIPNVKKDEVYMFDLKQPDNVDAANKVINSSLGKIFCENHSQTYKILKKSSSERSLRDYINKNDPYKQLKYWWDQADDAQKARFKRELLQH